MNINRSDGWVKLHKKVMFSSLWEDNYAWRTFTTLLLMAHHEENFASIRFRGKQRYLQPGELSISKLELADYLQYPTNRVKTVLERLKSEDRIAIETDNHKTIIRICKWKQYQAKDNQPKSQQDNQPKVDQGTNQPTNPHHIKRIKNKEYKNSKETLEAIEVYDHYIKASNKNPLTYKFTTERKEKVCARLRDIGKDRLLLAITNAHADDFFLSGRTWGNLDYLVRKYENAEKYANLSEGVKNEW